MNAAFKLAESRIEVIRKTSFLLTNELLFCVLYYIHELAQPLSITKIAKDLQVEEQLIQDHVSILARQGFISKQGNKYRVTAIGREAVAFVVEGAGRAPRRPLWTASAETYAEILSDAHFMADMPTVQRIEGHTPPQKEQRINTQQEKAPQSVAPPMSTTLQAEPLSAADAS